MKVAFAGKPAAGLILIALLGLAACVSGNAPLHYYMLSPLPEAGSSVPSNVNLPAIGVGPVSMADYLNRPQIVTRTDQNRLQIHDSRQWAEIPKTAFSRILTQNLSLLLSSNQVFAFPWRQEAHIRYQVMVDVDRFDGDGTEAAVLHASWSIADTVKNTILIKQRTDIREPSEGSGYDYLVEAQSRALARLSRQIADALKKVLEQAK